MNYVIKERFFHQRILSELFSHFLFDSFAGTFTFLAIFIACEYENSSNKGMLEAGHFHSVSIKGVGGLNITIQRVLLFQHFTSTILNEVSFLLTIRAGFILSWIQIFGVFTYPLNKNNS